MGPVLTKPPAVMTRFLSSRWTGCGEVLSAVDAAAAGFCCEGDADAAADCANTLGESPATRRARKMNTRFAGNMGQVYGSARQGVSQSKDGMTCRRRGQAMFEQGCLN